MSDSRESDRYSSRALFVRQKSLTAVFLESTLAARKGRAHRGPVEWKGKGAWRDVEAQELSEVQRGCLSRKRSKRLVPAVPAVRLQ